MELGYQHEFTIFGLIVGVILCTCVSVAFGEQTQYALTVIVGLLGGVFLYFALVRNWKS